ncbi:hypothetical protein TWF225_008523 [Orbilia oligospora]|uniref:Uncharacterized protein n=1 Tax=Orbilia oligospora TaxID=2813651 RepID=A0A7C8PEY4_ORBOL|nr:hypothetical protein TWF751_004098 [Orbilia oligospora]KAF3177129.1 hypothetical protein TWF225_008523 [Orbilia oligospora]KAF3245770.1 hypothetical protein TWF217_010393 [Orbilia oligospora]KAF3249262.1 hypothetical protein TWF128_007930 [Orbilia oligospora]KAF3288942.1 hypothetical protein TWF132_007814 [Orbilia oligospora]
MEVAGGVEPTEKQVNPGKNLLKEERREGKQPCRWLFCLHGARRSIAGINAFWRRPGCQKRLWSGLSKRKTKRGAHPSQASFVPGCEIGSCVVASSSDLSRFQRMVFRGCGGTKVIVWRGLSPSAFVLKPNFSTPTSKLHTKPISRYCYWPGHWL